MAKLGDLIVRVGADTRGLNKSLGDVKKQMRQTTGNLTQMGKSLSMSLTAPILGLGALAVKAASDFEFSMAKVQAVSGFTATEIGKLEEQAQELGASTSRSASDVASLQLELAKLGKTSTEIEQMTEGVLSLSVAFDTELGETARVVGATLNQFGLEASESGRIVDNMAVLFGSSALDLEKFDAAMRTVGPTASDMGLSVEEAGAALGVLVNAGVDASTAGTALTKSLVTLAKEGMTGKEAIDALTTGQLNTAQAFEVFGDRAGKVIPILQKSTEKYAELTEKQLEGSGAALKARKILEDTAQGGFDRLRSSVEALGISFGEGLLPLVNEMTDAVSGFASRMASMSDEAKTATLLFGGFLAALGPALIVLPNLVNGLKLMRVAQMALNKAVLANPYIAAAAAVAALGFAIYKYTTKATEAEKIQKKLADVSKKIETSYAKEASSMEFLRFQYKEAGDDLEKRKDILQEIAIISPETVKDLDAETLSYNDLSTAVDGYLISLKNKIKLRISEEAVTAALEDQIRLEEERDRLAEQQLGVTFALTKAQEELTAVQTSGGYFARKAALDNVRNLLKQQRSYSPLNEAIKENNASLAANEQLLSELSSKYNENANSIGDVKTISELFAVLQSTKVAPALKEVTEEVIKQGKALGELLTPLEAAPIKTEPLKKSLAGVSTAVSDMGRDVAVNLNKPITVMDSMIDTAVLIGDAFGSAFESMKNNGMSFAEALGEQLKELLRTLTAIVVKMLIIEGIVLLIESLTGKSDAAKGFGKRVLSGVAESFGIELPEFKDGGIVSGPTLGLVGEYPGASTNPEVIAPLDKLRSMMGAQSVVVTGKISGRDILLTSERNAIDRNRVRGF